jgi:hypothetical protein
VILDGTCAGIRHRRERKFTQDDLTKTGPQPIHKKSVISYHDLVTNTSFWIEKKAIPAKRLKIKY